jgi:hypothetical protein
MSVFKTSILNTKDHFLSCVPIVDDHVLFNIVADLSLIYADLVLYIYIYEVSTEIFIYLRLFKITAGMNSLKITQHLQY